MSRVLVTGSSGFLGNAIMSHLAACGYQSLGLDPAAPAPGTVAHIRDDLANRDGLTELLRQEKISYVIHCGGISGPMVMSDAPAQIMEINVAGSLNLLQASLANGVKTFVFCSSVAALGNFYEAFPITDEYPLQPDSPYGASKAAVDMVLRGLWKRVPLDLCSLRFTGIFGPHRRTQFAIDDIVAAAFSGDTITLGPSSDWPYIYIDDAAKAAVAACFSSKRQQLFYFVSHAERVTFEDIAKVTARLVGKAPDLRIDPNLPTAARGLLDIGPAQRDFGFTPAVDYREGIRRMVEAYQGTRR